MSDFRSGEIKLDSPKAVFYSGQQVSGSVFFTLSEPLSFSAITIDCLGEAEVLWTENMKEVHFGRERIKVVEYKGVEQYFKYSQCLVGDTVGMLNNTQLPIGSHSFPFKFNIPYSAPSSFKGEVGTVTYSITATLIFPDPNVLNEALFKEIKVVAPLDLNTGSPDIKNPINLEFEEEYGCGCICTPKPMRIQVHLPVTGYCPGQDIPITVDVDNESSTEITKTILELVCREKYRSQRLPGEYSPPEVSLVKAKTGAVMGKSKKSISLNLRVPDILPAYLDNCAIIDVAYFFKVTFKLSGCSSNLTDEAEICLGLVPLSGFTNGPYIHPLKDSLPDGPIPDPVQIVQPSENPFVNEKSQLTSLNSDFKPNIHMTPYPTPPNTYPTHPSTYPIHPSTYPTQPGTYPTQPSTYPLQPNINYNANNNSRPSSGSYGFALGPTSPGYPNQDYGNGNTNVNRPGVNPSAPPPYS
ncbi:hypothetical protein K1T71_009092 [Dendrolimus kikuchii]|uniref:Uncharacterized protein n=1 Tax=Dendrolimus kikuchii TaxID=765133 RepID=A0ACC1CTS6_9NEOP|nr:hypothetical protein K1T71_009092 [Dendrolimus kikuchii]